jgi:hypothetical protein
MRSAPIGLYLPLGLTHQTIVGTTQQSSSLGGLGAAVTHRLSACRKPWVTPEPVIGPRMARTRWLTHPTGPDFEDFEVVSEHQQDPW